MKNPFYKLLFRSAVLNQSAEFINERFAQGMEMLGNLHHLCRGLEWINQAKPQNGRTLWGLHFPNVIGLGAGIDPHGKMTQAAGALGFGFAEIGTVTHLRQLGNLRPRLWWAIPECGIIERQGFPNDGAEATASLLAKMRHPKHTPDYPIGVCIGKSKGTTNSDVIEDVLTSFNLLADYADYMAIHLGRKQGSEANELSAESTTLELLKSIQTTNEERSSRYERPKIPLLLKIMPDLPYKNIDMLLPVLIDLKYEGIIIGEAIPKTLSVGANDPQPGMLCGKPLESIVVEKVRYIKNTTRGKLSIIAAGGIHNSTAASKMLDAGADLLQLSTALFYEGPFFAKTLARLYQRSMI
jgi:dihydroorotate dehydrogenase